MNWLSKQPQAIKPQPAMLVTKVFLPDSEIRRTKLSVTSFSDLCHELATNFLNEEERNQVLKLKYRDDRNDWITFDTEEEFQDAVEILRYEQTKNPTAALCVAIHLEEKVPVLVKDPLPDALEDMFDRPMDNYDMPALENVTQHLGIMDKNENDEDDSESSVSVEEVMHPQEVYDDEESDDDDEDRFDFAKKAANHGCYFHFSEDESDYSEDEEDDENEKVENDSNEQVDEEIEKMRASAHLLSQSVGSLLMQAPQQVPVLPEPAYESQVVPEPVEQITIPVQFGDQIKLLAEMGIGNTKDNIELLEKHNGDVHAVINAMFQ